MKEHVKYDPVSTEVIDMTALGIMELTRKKRGRSLKEQL
ncbi:MAG: ribonuclease E/G [Candidatus Alectryocaccobium sp.]|nr:ribonuclease E/G [Candidatus Alectryocaccobium sp.]